MGLPAMWTFHTRSRASEEPHFFLHTAHRTSRFEPLHAIALRRRREEFAIGIVEGSSLQSFPGSGSARDALRLPPSECLGHAIPI
jgi:hypothetical protein